MGKHEHFATVWATPQFPEIVIQTIAIIMHQCLIKKKKTNCSYHICCADAFRTPTVEQRPSITSLNTTNHNQESIRRGKKHHFHRSLLLSDLKRNHTQAYFSLQGNPSRSNHPTPVESKPATEPANHSLPSLVRNPLHDNPVGKPKRMRNAVHPDESRRRHREA